MKDHAPNFSYPDSVISFNLTRQKLRKLKQLLFVANPDQKDRFTYHRIV